MKEKNPEKIYLPKLAFLMEGGGRGLRKKGGGRGPLKVGFSKNRKEGGFSRSKHHFQL